MDDNTHEVLQWILKAKSDLASAEVLFERELYDTAVYHCQQSAEKALKAYLAWREQPVLKVHDLTMLVKECVLLDSSFSVLMSLTEILTPYATAFRYPGDVLCPDVADVEEALKLSKELLVFVLSKFSDEIKGRCY